MDLKTWFKTYDAYHARSDEYNARLVLVRAEREKGNWLIDVQAEYAALHEAQSLALAATEALYQTMKQRERRGG